MVRAVGFVLALLVSPALANDDLVRDMELDVQIQELSKDTLKKARDAAWEAYDQTSHRRRLDAAYAKHLGVIGDPGDTYKEAQAQVHKAEAELKAQQLLYDLAHRTAKIAVRLPEHHPVAKKALSSYREQAKRMEAAIAELDNAQRAFAPIERQYEARKASAEAGYTALRKEQQGLINRFARKLYEREMRQRLTELKIAITEAVKQKVRRSFEKWEI